MKTQSAINTGNGFSARVEIEHLENVGRLALSAEEALERYSFNH